jgi:flagellar protein FlaJ
MTALPSLPAAVDALRYLPGALAVALLAVLALTLVVDAADRAFVGLALAAFGDRVSRERARKAEQLSRLRAAHVSETHRAYASRAAATGVVAGVAVGVLSVYGAWVALDAFGVGSETVRAVLPAVLAPLAGVADVPAAGPVALLAAFGAGVVCVGPVAGLLATWSRWAYLDQLAAARASAVETTLPRTVAFVYALSRSGTSFPDVLDTLRRNRAVYGAAAEEVGVAVRDMDTFGTDVLTALNRVSRRTPSENMAEFSENLASVLGSGRSLPEFLRSQYERYQEEAEAQQEQYLQLLSTLAEVYVTVLVAGPLFFITVLVVVGLVIADTLPVLRFLGYVGIPLATVGFVVYVDSITHGVGDVSPDEAEPVRPDAGPGAGSAGAAATDGGVVDAPRNAAAAGPRSGSDGGEDPRIRRSRRRLAAYDVVRPLRRWLREPVRTLTETPGVTLALTLPLGLAWLLARGGLDAASRLTLRPVAPGPGGVLDAVDTPLLEVVVVALGAYALVYEVGKRRRVAYEEAVPDLLDRMASVNEAGLTVVESIERLAGSSLGALDEELSRTWRDVRWGADVTAALRRLDRRTNVPAITRAVTLVTNSMAASGDIGPVLRIAADEANQSRRLRRQRRQEMLTYIVVIYVSFLVFLGIVTALTVAFMPAIEEAAAGAAAVETAGVSAGPLSGLQDVQPAAYSLLFFHASAVQAACSGLVAGLLGEGDVRAGAKHATVLLTFTYVLFAFIG